MHRRNRASSKARLATAGWTLVVAGLNLHPASAEEQWLTLLRLQIKDSHGCLLQHIVHVREVPAGKQLALEGRLRCVDGREYDFTRAKPHQKFDIRLCQPTIC